MNQMLRRIAALTLSVVAFTASVLASPALPGFLKYTQPDGTVIEVRIEGNEHAYRYYNTSGQLLYANPDGSLTVANDAQRQTLSAKALSATIKGTGLKSTGFTHTGTVRTCVILVQFADVKFTTADPQAYFNRWLNESGFSDNGAIGSVRDYFIDQSNGAFKPQFDVYGPVTLSGNRSAYADTDTQAYKMVHQAAAALDSEIDFSIYDINGDGNVDNVFIIFAGQSSNDGGANSPWPHCSYCPDGLLSKQTNDGKMLYHYGCVGELNNAGETDGIGTFIHEFGHVLGLSDHYNTVTSTGVTPNFWDVMDVGCYNDSKRKPCNYNAFERQACDWLTPKTISKAASVKLRPLDATNFAVRIDTDRDGDYYLLESRRSNKWDSGMHGHGLFIWHIDASAGSNILNHPNNDSNHMCVDLVEADGTPGVDTWENIWGDPWPGATGNTEFTATSTPAMVQWTSATGSGTTPVNKPITNIAFNSTTGISTFDVMGGSATNIVDIASVEYFYYTAIADPEEGGSVQVGSFPGATRAAIESGNRFLMTATPAFGYRFVQWTDESNTTLSTNASVNITANERTEGTYTAHFEAIPVYTISAVASPANCGSVQVGDVEGATSAQVQEGDQITLTAFPAEGYKILNWTNEAGDVVGTSTTLTVSGTQANAGTYTANFVLIQYFDYNVVASPAKGGTVKLLDSEGVTSAHVSEFETVSFRATPNQYYQWSHWENAAGERVTTAATLTLKSSAETAGTYTAIFIREANAPVEYCEPEGTVSRTDRDLTSITISDDQGSESVTTATLRSSSDRGVYYDRTETVFTTKAGSTVTLTPAGSCIWTHSYVYIDWAKDGFDYVAPSDYVDLDNNCAILPGVDLVYYSRFAPTGKDPNAGGSWYSSTDGFLGNSGDVHNASATDPCTFTIPEDTPAGTYRLRFKSQWCSLDPCGGQDVDHNNTLASVGGMVVDMTIIVETDEAEEDSGYTPFPGNFSEGFGLASFSTTEANENVVETLLGTPSKFHNVIPQRLAPTVMQGTPFTLHLNALTNGYGTNHMRYTVCWMFQDWAHTGEFTSEGCVGSRSSDNINKVMNIAQTFVVPSDAVVGMSYVRATYCYSYGSNRMTPPTVNTTVDNGVSYDFPVNVIPFMTGIDGVDADVNTFYAYTSGRNVMVNAPAEGQVRLTDMSGRTIAVVNAARGLNILPVAHAGVYVVSYNNQSVKVMVD